MFISLSLFIEIFSFFFLKLYKSGLTEIKYFQNELTNIEMKFVSLDTALCTGEKDTITGVISEFSKTERNFILEKGQSTVELECSKANSQSVNSVLASFKNITLKYI